MKHGITSSLTSSLARSICPKQSDIMKTSFCLCIATVCEVKWMKDHLNINDVNFRNFLAFSHIEFYLKINLVDLDN